MRIGFRDSVLYENYWDWNTGEPGNNLEAICGMSILKVVTPTWSHDMEKGEKCYTLTFQNRKFSKRQKREFHGAKSVMTWFTTSVGYDHWKHTNLTLLNNWKWPPNDFEQFEFDRFTGAWLSLQCVSRFRCRVTYFPNIFAGLKEIAYKSNEWPKMTLKPQFWKYFCYTFIIDHKGSCFSSFAPRLGGTNIFAIIL